MRGEERICRALCDICRRVGPAVSQRQRDAQHRLPYRLGVPRRHSCSAWLYVAVAYILRYTI